MRVRSAKVTELKARSSEELAQRLDRRFDRSQSIGIERAEPLGEPGRSPLADRAEQALALGRQLEPDAAPIDLGAQPPQQAGALEPVDLLGERGSGDRLRLCQAAQREAGARLDDREQRRLAGGDAELLGLLAQLARDAQHDRPQVVREGKSQIRSCTNHYGT